MRCRLFLLLLLLCCTVPALGLELTAVSPSTVFPGTSVALAGGPFRSGATVLIGSQRVAADELSAGRLNFTVPQLASGEYALAVEQSGERSRGAFILRVVQPPPRIRELDPTTIDSCGNDSNRQIVVSGSSFQPGADLLFDNASLAVDKRSSSEIVFTLPPVKGGLHQVQVVNPDNQKSLPHSLIVNSTPEISDVQLGDDRTVDYELIVHGKNFAYDSQVLVDGSAIGRSEPLASVSGVRRGSVRFIDCTTLVYTRQPFIREARELALQIVNPGGEASNVYRITAP